MKKDFDAIVIGSGQAGPFLAVRMAAFGLRVLHTRARAPKANAYSQDCTVVARMVLGGLHHEYQWEKIAA